MQLKQRRETCADDQQNDLVCSQSAKVGIRGQAERKANVCQGTSEDVTFHLTRVHQTQENALKSA